MYQKMVIAGNLGRDPEMRYTPSGQAVTNLNVATNRQYTSNSGEKVKETNARHEGASRSCWADPGGPCLQLEKHVT